MPLLVGAMSLGMITIFQLQAGVTSKTGNTADAQIAAAVFVKDVQSASRITAPDIAQLQVPSCNAVGETTAKEVLGLEWNNFENVVSYVTVPSTVGSTTTYSLVRQSCTLGNLSAPSSTTVSNNYPIDTPITIDCAQACTSVDWNEYITADNIKSVTIKFTPGEMIGTSPVKYTYFLQATPRIWDSSPNDGSSGGPPYAPLILLGGTSSPNPPTGCVSGSAMSIKQGTVSINVAGGSGDGGIAIASNCPDSVDISSNGTLLVGPVLTANTSSSPSIVANQPSTLVSGTVTNPTIPVYDPYANLAPPTSPTTPGACFQDTTSLIYYCTPGVFSSDPNFPNGSQVVFIGGGNYEFQAGLNLPGGSGSSYTFATGNYIFDGTNALTMGTSSVNIVGSNVLFYITGANATFANNSNINLTPESGNQGVTIWDSNVGGTLTLGNNSSTSTNTYGGIYAPYATVQTAQNGTVTCSFIVTSSAVFVNNTIINITAP